MQWLSAGAPARAAALSVEQRRADLARLLSLEDAPAEVHSVEALEAPGPAGVLRLRLYSPLTPRTQQLPALVYFHGGGLVAGDLQTHDGIARNLANAGGCRVVSVDYRLAPEARFPAALADACAASEWVCQHAEPLGIEPRRIGVCGDSVGAALAAAVCQSRRGEQAVPLALQVLLCPILDFRAEVIAARPYDQGDLLDRETLEQDVWWFLPPGADPGDPRISPLQAPDFSALPPAIIHTAECDPVCADGHEYAQQLHRAGIAVRYSCHPGMIHLFYGLGRVVPRVSEAYRDLGAQIREAFGSGRV